MDSFPKFLVLQERNVNQELCADVEGDAIRKATDRISGDTARRPVVIYKAVKIVRPRETPTVVEDLPE